MKRFTETTKWDDRWFGALSAKHKLVWLYIVDHCDSAGVWEPNFALAEFKLGLRRLNWEEVRVAMAKNVVALANGRWWIPSFIAFQYGPELKQEAAVHRSVIALLEKHGLGEAYAQWLDGKQSQQGKDAADNTMLIPLAWDRDGGDKVLSVLGGVGEEESYETIYSAYPRKVGKQAAVKAISRAVSRLNGSPALNGQPVRDWLLQRVRAYAEAVSRWPETERHFIPHPATWFNRGSYEDDPKTWERNTKKTGGEGRRMSFAS